MSTTIKAQAPSDSINASPNPFSQRTLVSFTLVNNDTISIRVYNLSGMLVVALINDSIVGAGVHQDSLRMDNFPDGIYIISLFNRKKNLKNVKIIKSFGTTLYEIHGNDLDYYFYPVPVSDKLRIRNYEKPTKIDVVQIHNSIGQLVFQFEYPEVNQEFDLVFLPCGVYYLQVKTTSGIKREKIIKN